MPRSLLPGFLEVQELEFWTCLCHHQRSTFLLKQVISEFHPCLWHLQMGLFLDNREPMRRMRDRLPHIESSLVKVGNAHVDQVKIVQVYVLKILKGVSSGVSSLQATRPWIWRGRSARRKSWTCWWTKPLGCTSGPQALQWPKDVNLYNMMKLLALVGMKTWKGRGVR